MLRPKNKEKEKVQISKESINNAKGIFGYIKPYRFRFIIGWLFLLMSSSTMIFFPYLMGQLLGSAGNNTSISNSLSLISTENINTVVILLFVLFGVQAIFSYFRVILFTNVTENTLKDIRFKAFEKLVYMPMDFFNKNKVGELTSRIANDINQLQETLRTTIAEFFRQIITVFGSIILLLFISWKLSLIMVATVPVMALIAVFFGRFIRKLSKQAQDHSAASNSIVEEALMGISNVKAFTNEIFLLKKYEYNLDEIKRLSVKAGIWRGLFISFIIFCMTGAIVFIIWQGLLLTQGSNPELSSADFFSFMLYTIMMVASVSSVPDLYASIQKSIGATDNLMNIINQDNEKELLKGTVQNKIQGEIKFENVSFSYPQRADISVLNNISLTIEKDQTIALVGTSGAGKSTISSLLLNYFKVTGGNILFDGLDIQLIDTKHLRSHIAIVPQEVILFAGSILENILFGRPEASKEEAIEAAKNANAYDFIMSFPEGFDTQVGDRGIQLSGGQKQRIAIARAILKNPTILILDEATSALDSESEKLVQEALDQLMEGRTSIVIAHRLSTIKKADKIIVLDKGTVAEEGTHNSLMAKNGLYANFVELQAMQY